jgi:hypothetical protein
LESPRLTWQFFRAPLYSLKITGFRLLNYLRFCESPTTPQVCGHIWDIPCISLPIREISRQLRSGIRTDKQGWSLWLYFPCRSGRIGLTKWYLSIFRSAQASTSLFLKLLKPMIFIWKYNFVFLGAPWPPYLTHILRLTKIWGRTSSKAIHLVFYEALNFYSHA